MTTASIILSRSFCSFYVFWSARRNQHLLQTAGTEARFPDRFMKIGGRRCGLAHAIDPEAQHQIVKLAAADRLASNLRMIGRGPE
jgi:hypothetical protein